MHNLRDVAGSAALGNLEFEILCFPQSCQGLACLLQNYVRNLVNFAISVVGHLENFDKMQAYLDQGDNVVCLANHQTEADPGTCFRHHKPQHATLFIYAFQASKSSLPVHIRPLSSVVQEFSPSMGASALHSNELP